MDFLPVCTHLLKVHTDDVILGGHLPKRLLKLYDLKNKRTSEVDFVHVPSYLLKL